MSQEALAERAGLSVRGISDLERGINRSPQRESALRLAAALGLSGQQQIAFVAECQRRGAGPARSGTHDGPRDTLPMPLTPLLGRETELQGLTDLLLLEPAGPSRARLITLTGPGGVGKTRLALAAAAGLARAYAGGVVFVPLAGLQDPALLPAVLAQSVGLRVESNGPVVEELACQLRAKQLLLVLDNFEHLLPAGPELARLLEVCTGLHVLVTSSAALRLRGEREVPVPRCRCPTCSTCRRSTSLRAILR